MEAKFSWNQLWLFNQAAVNHFKLLDGKETKFTYALSRVMRQIRSLQPQMQEGLEAIAIDHCYTEKRGETEVIVRDTAGNYIFTPESAKARDRKQREFLAEPHFAVDPFFVKNVPEKLSVDDLCSFAGLVFPVERLEELLTNLEGNLPEEIPTEDPGTLHAE